VILRDRNGLGNNNFFAWKDYDKFYGDEKSETFPRCGLVEGFFGPPWVDGATQSHVQIRRGAGDEHLPLRARAELQGNYEEKRQYGYKSLPLLLPQEIQRYI